MMRNSCKEACLKRLSRIEGQVRGLARMVGEDRYCIDIITQITAVRAALKRVEHELLGDHVSHCMKEAFQSSSADGQERKIKELIAALERSNG